MKTFKAYALLGLFAVLTSALSSCETANAQTSSRILAADYILGQADSKNYVINPSAFTNANSVAVANSATVSRNTTTPLTAVADFAFTMPNNTTGSITWTLSTLDRSVAGANCAYGFTYTASSVGTNVRFEVVQGGVAIGQSDPLVASSTPRTVYVNIPCNNPTSGATTVRLQNQTGNTGTSAGNIARVLYGLASNFGPVAQSTLVGAARFPNGGNPTKTGGTLAAFTADAAFPGPTVITNPGPGVLATTDVDKPVVTVNSLPAGVYVVTFTGGAGVAGTSDNALAISDGTNTRGRQSTSIAGAHVFPFNVQAVFEYTTSGNRTFELFASSSASTVSLQNATQNAETQFSIVRLPSAAEIAVRPDQADFPWTRDTDLETLTANSVWNGFGTLTESSAYVSRQGDSLWLRTQIRAGTPTAAVSRINLPSKYTIDTAKLGTGQRILGSCVNAQNANTNIGSGNLIMYAFFDSSQGSASTSIFFTQNVASIQLTVRNTNDYLNATDRTYCLIGPIPISGWRGNQSAPLLVGSVTSGSSGAERLERATIASSASPCTASPCTITRQSGSWITSVTRTSTGFYTVNFASGTFSAPPSCTYSAHVSIYTDSQEAGPPTTSSSSVIIRRSSTLAAEDSGFDILCMGPR